MECNLCTRYLSGDATLHCPACARALLYPHRINQARLLLDKDQLRVRVEAALGKANDATTEETTQAKAKLEHQSNLSEIKRSKERVEEIVKKSESLKEKLEQYRKDIQSRKAAAEQRRKETEATRSEFSNTRPGVHEQLKKSAKRRTHRYDDLYSDIITARIYLCREAADLAGLRRHQRAGPDGTKLESYTLNGLAVIDLRDFNNSSPQQITASLTNVSRLLVQVCYYLGVRLPAEITLPGENYPLPTIFTPASSFLPHNKDVAFPGITSSNSSSPTASRTLDSHDQATQSKLRPLYLDRKLSVLMREDPSQYSHFIEGISLLAWCIAWLCRTQGLSIAKADWEEICAVGRNLWLLLIDATTAAKYQLQQKQQLHKDGRPKPLRKGTSDSSTRTTASSKPPAPAPHVPFGILSHGTAHGPLLLTASTSTSPSPSAASSAAALAPTGASTPASTPTPAPIDVSPRTWKFASPTGIRDSLKRYLLNDMSAQEWEVLSSGEFEGWVAGPGSRGTVDEEPVVVAAGAKGESASRRTAATGGPARRATDTKGGGDATGEHASATANGTELDGEDGDDPSRPRGSSGWMKLKSRTTL